MSAVVVRCPACRGASQVGQDAVGLLVACPRCQEPFLAIEEAAPVPAPPRPARSPLAPPESGGGPRPLRPRATPRDPARRRNWAEPVAPPDDTPISHAAPDPHLHSDLAPGGLPLSVMIGFALLPFAIPLLWVAALLLTGQQPSLTIATPISLAVSGSVLCLAVVFTVDWSPATRLKGVLMLVSLAYFAAFSLFFLKKDMIDWAKQALSPERKWKSFQPPDGSYHVKLPLPHPKAADKGEPLPGWNLTSFRSVHRGFTGPTTFIVGAGQDAGAEKQDNDAWFQQVGQKLAQQQRGKAAEPLTLTIQNRHPGRQWRIEFPAGNRVRIVRVYRVDRKVYFLSAEGPGIDPNDEDDISSVFFRSFEISSK